MPYLYYLLAVFCVSWIMDWSLIGVFLSSVFLVLLPLTLGILIWEKFSCRSVSVVPKSGDIIRDPRTGEPVINPATGNPYVVPATAAAGVATGMAFNQTDGAPVADGEDRADAYCGHRFTDDSSDFDSTAINPATGLPMVGGMGGVDVMGNTYGMSFDFDSDSSNIGIDIDSSGSDDYGGFDFDSSPSFSHGD